MNRIRFSYIAIFAVILLMGTSCSTQKNNFPNRAYHTTTSKFNVHFNGKEALKTGETELAKKSKDNFLERLPIYNYPAKTDLPSIYPSMDRAIEKSAKAIYKHSMMIRGVEHVKTMDDVYLIMSKAYFHKQDYGQSLRLSNYIANTFNGKKWNCREEAMILGIRSAIRLEQYSTALTQMNTIQHDLLYKNKKKKLKVLFNAAAAEYHLTAPNGEIPLAIDHIKDAIANKPEKNFATRLYFILGQLYENTEQLADAQKCFRKVIQRTPEYDMEFSAHMHLATNYDGSDADRELIMKGLNKMLGELKNENYRDQIYYAMSKIAKIDENEEEQIEYLALSVASYSDNGYQRTFSAVELGDIYFENESYIDAQAYYDTALLTLPGNYPNRENVIKKGEFLRGLVDNLNTIALQDSLQRIAKMSERERTAWVNGMIAKYTEAERLAAEEEANRMRALEGTAGFADINLTSSNGKWYFYNQSLMTTGKTEFFRLWGNRKLEDNWRISNKQQISFDDMAVLNDPSLEKETVEYDDEGNPIKQRETDPKKAEFYLQDLPMTPGAIDTSNGIIADAMYNAAIIYLEELKDIRRSNETMEKFIVRFPSHELTLSAIYMLYRSYLSINDPRAETHKNTILTQHPDTDYARLITDPDYYKRLAEKEKQLERRYEEMYDVYINMQWGQVIAIANEAVPLCLDIDLKSKYDYLRAVAIGQTLGEDSLISNLSRIIREYPKTPVAELAAIYLSGIEKEVSQVSQNEDGSVTNNTQAAQNPFVNKPEEMHHIIIIVNINDLVVNDVKTDISAFNETYFKLVNFNVSSFYINQNEQMITISKFKNKDACMDYYHAIISNELFTSPIANRSMTVYAISATNYTTYYNKTNDRGLYLDFFKNNYLK